MTDRPTDKVNYKLDAHGYIHQKESAVDLKKQLLHLTPSVMAWILTKNFRSLIHKVAEYIWFHLLVQKDRESVF